LAVRFGRGVAEQPQPTLSPFVSASVATCRIEPHAQMQVARLPSGSADIARHAPNWPSITKEPPFPRCFRPAKPSGALNMGCLQRGASGRRHFSAVLTRSRPPIFLALTLPLLIRFLTADPS
jgi:hypothetical protein